MCKINALLISLVIYFAICIAYKSSLYTYFFCKYSFKKDLSISSLTIPIVGLHPVIKPLT